MVLTSAAPPGFIIYRPTEDSFLPAGLASFQEGSQPSHFSVGAAKPAYDLAIRFGESEKSAPIVIPSKQSAPRDLRTADAILLLSGAKILRLRAQPSAQDDSILREIGAGNR